jgi:hypothetical protein
VFEGSAHAANLERSEEFNRAVLGFIADNAAARPAAA